MSSHTRAVLSLYKKILRLHETLPIDLKVIGDQYVKSEFKLHKTSAEEFIPEFMKQWYAYAELLDNQVKTKAEDNNIGKNLELKSLDNLSEDQTVQLYELMKETKKENRQFNIKDE